MANKITIVKGEKEYVYEDIFGHQIGNGAVQVLKKDGDQVIIGGFDKIDLELDEEARAAFEQRLAQAEIAAKAETAANDESEGNH